MNTLLDTTLAHLRTLVSFDTRNPPREIGTGGIFDYLRAQLPAFDCTVTDHGAGAVSLYATRGQPKILFNVHLDTVPATPTWTRDPHDLLVAQDRAIGLGACDIKGAAAALLTVAAHSQGDAAFLFTTDEEANDARCIAAFLNRLASPAQRGTVLTADSGALANSAAGPKGERQDNAIQRDQGNSKPCIESVIVAEPTRCEAVLAHRGISSVLMRFAGRAGHASGDRGCVDSALHQAIRWGANALDYVESQSHQRFGGLTGLRFNIGRIEGGIKANVIAPAAELRFGFRPLPSMDADVVLETFARCADRAPVEVTETFRGPSLPAGDVSQAEARRLAARDLADGLGLPIGNAVDFWTEASLFSQGGYTTLVCGPGDIAQAHSADEFVELSQLQQITESYMGIIDSRIMHHERA